MFERESVKLCPDTPGICVNEIDRVIELKKIIRMKQSDSIQELVGPYNVAEGSGTDEIYKQWYNENKEKEKEQ